MALGWKIHGDGKNVALHKIVAPGERLSWPRTIGAGAHGSSTKYYFNIFRNWDPAFFNYHQKPAAQLFGFFLRFNRQRCTAEKFLLSIDYELIGKTGYFP